MNQYETVAIDQIQHRHPSKYFLGKGEPITEPTYFAQYLDNGEWYTLVEGDENAALAEIERCRKMDGTSYDASQYRIVIVVPAEAPKPVRTVAEEVAEVIEEARREEQAEAPRTMADEARQMIAEAKAEESAVQAADDPYAGMRRAFLRDWETDMELSPNARMWHRRSQSLHAPALTWNEQLGRYA